SASERPDPLDDIIKINEELARYSPELASRPQILVGNKVDMGYSEEDLERIKAYADEKGWKLFLISGIICEGVPELLAGTAKMLDTLPPMVRYEEEFIEQEKESGFDVTVEKADGIYAVKGEWLIRLCNDINFDDYESLNYFQRVLRDKGVIRALEDAGISEGDTVDIYGIEFDFMY
ncbi:MAG: Obg family GTPase CgtA, partial [Clostridia bacterium]|nr:Obg family GTPase CgtA [Clostridia bacterium]